jgi:hypothetical protein
MITIFFSLRICLRTWRVFTGVFYSPNRGDPILDFPSDEDTIAAVIVSLTANNRRLSVGRTAVAGYSHC